MLSVNTTGGAGASSQLPANLQQGLVAYYPFNGNANDESGNGNDGLGTNLNFYSNRLSENNAAALFDQTTVEVIDLDSTFLQNELQ